MAISDPHSSYRAYMNLKVARVDLLIVAGDMIIDDYYEAVEMGKWLNSLNAQHSVLVFGNRDVEAESTLSLRNLEKAFDGSTVIHNEIIEFMGYRIFGSPNTLSQSGAFQLGSKEGARKHWAEVLPEDADVDIIITHGPPLGYGDVVRNSGHKGDVALLKAVQGLKKKPLLWICGHIHDGHGVYSVPHPQGEITLINAAVWEYGKGVRSARPRVIKLPEVRVFQPTEQEIMYDIGNSRRPSFRSSDMGNVPDISV
eukprot:CAMPEP_0175071716 /NCGR_PEP_ID=MMETSP0052_2-20121109/19409_1 /TAXON_ID=51329 ORGANISM="Polytomella parva, Strain SAG 63-3" /NCGR_SAMPLE_ID=MMETSP0052_2 /ASSEMBLY_ACC=CAM_ASM_000194 /LENGTH=254 /DNA_ID=CAMNT_0016338941 /DNA_START=198 /DNA_END=962 /DNA_ORIENTATION=+